MDVEQSDNVIMIELYSLQVCITILSAQVLALCYERFFKEYEEWGRSGMTASVSGLFFCVISLFPGSVN